MGKQALNRISWKLKGYWVHVLNLWMACLGYRLGRALSKGSPVTLKNSRLFMVAIISSLPTERQLVRR
ncbi:Nacht, Lrr And Pyd Domains-Containing Protein 6 [Manis pentadactyla]|nr:Nacht, Lrr And Pyd Domains-Containing Protein 6 [Manis pentadactyla]